MNNPAIYDAVLAGVAGSTQAITNQTPGSIITLFADHADDLATAVDTLIPVSGSGISVSQSALMSQIVSGLIYNRFLGDFISPSNGFGTNVSSPNYAAIARVVVTIYTAMASWLVNPSYHPSQTVTGTTVQQQIDSIVAGLVAAFHWTDARTL